MRIVSVADTHLFTKDLPPLPEADVLIHAGDLLRGGTLEELREGLHWLASQRPRHKILVAGNHDWCFSRYRKKARHLTKEAGVLYLEDEGVELEDIKFWGSPWQPAYHNWAFNLPRGAALANKWSMIPADLDILITHSPPLGFGDRSPVPGRHGCAELAARVKEVQPVVHIFGHIHQDGGLWKEEGITYINATTWECDRPASLIDYRPKERSVQALCIPKAEW